MIDKKWEINLQQLRAELILFKEAIKETSRDIIKENYSQYPIFIAHNDDVLIGEKILDKKDMTTYYNISASTLEEFVEKKVISIDKVDEFKRTYKKPKEFICFFVVVDLEAFFVYIPYDSPATTNN